MKVPCYVLRDHRVSFYFVFMSFCSDLYFYFTYILKQSVGKITLEIILMLKAELFIIGKPKYIV